MGILSKLDEKIKKAEQKYAQVKKDTENLRRVGGKAFDIIIPPPRKGGKPTIIKAKCPPCPCSDKTKKKRR